MGGNPQHQPAWETTTAPPVAVLSNEASSASSHAAETGRNSQSHSRQSSEVSSTAEKQTGAITSSTISNGKLSHDENTKLPLGESATATIKAVERHKRFTPNLRTLLSFAALTLSIFLVALDTVLIPTALPTISLSFYVRDSLYAWAGSAYLLANAASVPFWGKLSDVFGRKPIILVANCIFIGGSILCAISADAVMLVAGRTVQGLGGGGVVVLVHVCVADMFTIRYVFTFPIHRCPVLHASRVTIFGRQSMGSRQCTPLVGFPGHFKLSAYAYAGTDPSTLGLWALCGL